MSLYSRWAQREHGFGARMVATLIAGVVVAILIPLVIVKVGRSLDQRLGLQGFQLGAVNYIIGGLLVAAGLSFAWWSIYVQITRGRGTPLPMLPTQELLTTGPFQYCRNPMTLGTILAYLGIAIIAGSVMGLVLMACFIALLLLYLKRMEEKELAERFGEAYLAYQREVPFIIPRLPRRGKRDEAGEERPG